MKVELFRRAASLNLTSRLLARVKDEENPQDIDYKQEKHTPNEKDKKLSEMKIKGS